MHFAIVHRIEFDCDQPSAHVLQRLRMMPQNTPTQTVQAWTLVIDGAKEEVRFTDHFGNDTRLISVEGGPRTVVIEAAGEVETVNKAGVTGPHRGFAPLWLFERETPLTVPDEATRALVAGLAKGREIAGLHELMAALHEQGAPGAPPRPAEMQSSGAPASQSQSQSVDTAAGAPSGDQAAVPRGRAHRFIAAARLLGFPARYVEGVFVDDPAAGKAVGHGWAEAHVGGLGWVGFDPAHAISPDERYVRIAVGRDCREAMPISGIQLGQSSERVAVRVTVEQ
jgi:transglutaminase-like putative cysteine protease